MYSFKKIPLLRPWCCGRAGRPAGRAVAGHVSGRNGPAAEGVLANPTSAVLSPSGGRLEVEETAPVSTKDNVSVVTFVIPGDAENLQLTVPGQTVARWSMTPQVLEAGGELSRLRDELTNERARLSGQLDAVKARLALWKGLPDRITLQDLEQREKRMEAVIPGLGMEQADLERRVNILQPGVATPAREP